MSTLKKRTELGNLLVLIQNVLIGNFIPAGIQYKRAFHILLDDGLIILRVI